MHMTHNLDPFQWDADKSQEVLFCGKEAVLLLDRQANQWSSKTLIDSEKSKGFLGAGEVRAGKLRNNRIIATIEPMHGTNALVYTQGENESWQRHLLDDRILDGHALACGDFLKK